MGTNTGLGIGIGIPFKNNALGGDKPYFPPELKARMIGVWTNYGKKNTDADRNIIKNKIPNAGGDLEILNAAYKLNSGFGEYSEDFTTWTKSNKITSVDSESFSFSSNANYVLLYYKSNIGKDTPSFKVHIKLKGKGKVYYNYITSEGVYTNKTITSEEYVTPISYNTKYTGETPVNCGFSIGITSEEGSGTITQIPNFEDAFVTDGVNDLIISQKTVKEMIGDNDEITVISMIYYINTDAPARITITNDIRGMTAEDKSSQVFARNGVSIGGIGKLGIYGWSKKGTSTTVYSYFDILGDKVDYVSTANYGLADDAKFCPVGEPSLRFLSKQAHYWSFMVVGKLTKDEINLIIANYNLDRSLKPDILCNIGKQGITNDNHVEFNNKLIDYSGNGRDIQMNNLAWKGGSGIAAKKFETIKDYSIIPDEGLQELTIYNEFSFKIKSIRYADRYWAVQSLNKTDISYPVTIITDKDIIWRNALNYTDADGVKSSVRKETNVPANTPTQVFIYGFNDFDISDDYTKVNCVAYATRKDITEFTVTFIPSHKGGILLDGINDFGKVTGMPIYKDYTIVVNKDRISTDTSCILSKATTGTNVGAFITEFSTATYSFGLQNAFQTQRVGISYQSKYVYNGERELTAGSNVDTDTMWLGTIRDNDSRFFNGAIYSLMSFPYSMSEFLIERQLKKHKLGTLYPDMVEFRPIVKSNVKWDIIEIWQGDKSLYRPAVNDDKTGIYLKKDSTIGIYVKPYVGQKVSEIVYNGVSYTDLKLNSNGFYYKVVPITKSPQKITMTIEQDENYVKFEPIITANANYKIYYYLIDSNNVWKSIKTGDYITIGTKLAFQITFDNDVNELKEFVSSQLSDIVIEKRTSSPGYNIYSTINSESPQKINITIDEYIRYEDIKQPYPSIINLVSIDKTHFYTYGDKLKVGDVILYNSYKNLLKGLYSLNGQLKYNDVYIYDIDGRITVAKEMVFSWTVSPTWLFDNNEPKCILSPRLLRIPNSSYKILGYIPDISGHGNHGVIHNSAYAGASGANGYKQDFTSWKTNSSRYSIVTDSKYILTNEKAITNGGYFLWNRLAKDSFKVKISNIPNGGWMSYRYKVTEEDTQVSSLFIREDGIYTLPATIADSEVDFFISTVSAPAKDWVGLTIEQIGEYEGAYCLDGVDDFITIPTLSSGGKQVLMKVNWQSIAGTAILYDQRTNGGFAIFNRDFDTNENKVPAYRARNIGGSTYIDGILNEYIYASELKDITHNIVELCDPESNIGTLSPRVGYSYLNSNYAQMALYDFMLFDEISTDDKIEELNKYIGIEAKVELPPYYWDTYGKTNSDADRDTIQQRGIAVGDYDLINYNHAYEGMSGYNGYPVVFGESKTWEAQGTKDGDKYYIYTSNANKFNITQIKISSSLFYTYIKRNGELTSGNKDIPSFNLKVTGLDYDKFYLAYYYLKSADVEVRNVINITSDGIYELPKSFASDGSLTETNSYIGLSFIKKSSEIPDIIQNVNVTIEVLPEYENGLAYDGVEDYSENVNVPALTDYTYIFKRTLLNKKYNSASIFKGSNKQSGGGAFICDYNSVEPDLLTQGFSFGAGLYVSSLNTDNIIYGKKDSVNGQIITSGNNTDTEGLTIGKWRSYKQMVFYKLILYPKTIPLLQINFLKNLMEKDEIIDLNNPIFIKNE